MPRYFFHIRDDIGPVLDEEGMELADDAAARAEGELSAQEVLEHDRHFRIEVGDRRLEVTDSLGAILATINVPALLY